MRVAGPDHSTEPLDPPRPSRRRLLQGLVAVALGAAGAWVAWRRGVPIPSHTHAPAAAPGASPATTFADRRFRQPLRLPGREGLLADVALVAPLRLVAGRASFALFGGADTEVWNYAGMIGARAVANPLLRVRHGDTLQVTLRNQLAQDTTIHWHGLSVDEANDGSGLHPVAPGAERTYRLAIANRAGLYWYHAHPHGRTGEQLQRGLAALLLVEDAEELALRDALGLDWCVRDLPLLVADKQVDGGNAIVYRNGADDWIGNRMLVNWTPEPTHDVLPALYRLRIANASNARLLRLAFEHDGGLLPFRLIGTDGGLLAEAWEVEDQFLAPAQRMDVLMDFSRVPSGGRVTLRSLDYVAMENESESGAMLRDPMGEHPGAAPMGAPVSLMQFCVAGCAGGVAAPVAPPARVPARLSALPPPPDTRGWPRRALRLAMDAAGTWSINGRNLHRDGHAPLFTVRRGTREVWEIRNNMTSMPHPLHVHGLQFRVVSRAVSPQDVRSQQVAPRGLTPRDLGLNDTVLVWPGEVVAIALDFDQPFRGPQHYMIHCHNLEHEDMGMMVAFAIDD